MPAAVGIVSLACRAFTPGVQVAFGTVQQTLAQDTAIVRTGQRGQQTRERGLAGQRVRLTVRRARLGLVQRRRAAALRDGQTESRIEAQPQEDGP